MVGLECLSNSLCAEIKFFLYFHLNKYNMHTMFLNPRGTHIGFEKICITYYVFYNISYLKSFHMESSLSHQEGHTHCSLLNII